MVDGLSIHPLLAHVDSPEPGHPHGPPCLPKNVSHHQLDIGPLDGNGLELVLRDLQPLLKGYLPGHANQDGASCRGFGLLLLHLLGEGSEGLLPGSQLRLPLGGLLLPSS